MKNTILVTLFSLLFAFSSCETDKKAKVVLESSKPKEQVYAGDGFLIHGYLNKKEHNIYLKNQQDSILYKSKTDANGYFYFTGKCKDTIAITLVDEPNALALLLVNDEVEITKDFTIKDNVFQEEYNSYITDFQNINTLSPELIKEIKYKIINNKNLLKLRNKLAKQQYKEIVFLKNYIKNNPNSYSTLLALEALEYRASLSSTEYQKIWETLATSNTNTSLGITIENYFLEKALKSKKDQLSASNSQTKAPTNTVSKPKAVIEDRAKAYYFKGTTINGYTATLPNVVSKSKLVYIDFWASWCGPCRMQNPVLKSLYKKYHNQGLEIISISVDTDDNAWRNAVNIDGLPWIHIRDEDKTISSRYYVQNLPFGVLVDSKGMVIEDFVSAGKLKNLIPKYINEK